MYFPADLRILLVGVDAWDVGPLQEVYQEFSPDFYV